MVTKKLLLGGTVAVGSVATAAVVGVGQNGLFSNVASKTTDPQIELGSNREQSGAINNPTEAELKAQRKENIAKAEAETRRQEEAKGQDIKKVEKWLRDNQGSNNWQIKVKYGLEVKFFSEGDPTLLPDYLNKNTELLKSIAGTDTTFTFDSAVSDNKRNWKNIFTKEQILEWVKKTSDSKATLKLSIGNEAKELKDIQGEDLNKIFDGLFAKKDIFESLKNGSTKNILFEKIGNNWKHAKSEIDGWLTKPEGGDSKFEIKIKKSDDDSTDESDLIGLYKYLKENQQKLLKYKNPTGEKVALTLKKNGNWDVIHDEKTISNWVSNTSNKKAELKLYEDGSKKELTEITAELNQLFTALDGKRNLFEKVESYDENNKKIVVFEKYKKQCDDGNEGCERDKSWIHVKDAIDDFMESVDYQLKIGESKKEAKDLKDDELIGLLDHLQNNNDQYEQWCSDNSKVELVLKKKDGDGNNQWEQTNKENK